MVCGKCEKKLAKNSISAPDKWKDGANNTLEGGGRKVNENKLLSKKHRYTPYTQGKEFKCQTCKSVLHREGMFCHNCAYSKGVCEMCGQVVLENAKVYKQSTK
mmetsp:Transcript_34989/g.77833  ORF Transcript_34989/g.77833 Transcript_34989/m.77833 type:complete len:103 (-) Transcript_34989:2357-2665(-)